MRDTVLLLLAVLLAAPARGELIESDLVEPGDGLVTRDTETDLDWLDLPESVGLSFDAVQGGASGFVAQGWRYATEAEVCTFFHLHVSSLVSADACAPVSAGPFLSPGQAAAVDSVLTLLGATDVVAHSPWELEAFGTGLYDDGDVSGGVGLAEIRVGAVADPTPDPMVFGYSVLPDEVASSSALDTRGSFLVRAVPEPGATPLLGAGLGFLACAHALRRRSRAGRT